MSIIEVCNNHILALLVLSGCSDGDVRLINGTTSYEGRVEICYNGIWGSICDSSWDDWDAAVVCLQMGFQGTSMYAWLYHVAYTCTHGWLLFCTLTIPDATALRGSYFGDGDGLYHLSGISCNGNERTLLQCSRNIISGTSHSCTSGRDVGVKCDGKTYSLQL